MDRNRPEVLDGDAADLLARLAPCAYPNPKPGRIDDAACPGSELLRCGRPVKDGGSLAHSLSNERYVRTSLQVRFSEHDHVVQAFATYRSDEAVNVTILPLRACCGRVISDPHCTNAARIRRTECAVAVANEMTRRFVPGSSPVISASQ